MPKDDLADLRLDLAPKLNRPLSLWNPLDYLRLLFWIFYFPQALRWYVNRFGGGEPLHGDISFRTGIENLRNNKIQRDLLLQSTLLDLAFSLLPLLILSYLGLAKLSIAIDSLWILPGLLFAGLLLGAATFALAAAIGLIYAIAQITSMCAVMAIAATLIAAFENELSGFFDIAIIIFSSGIILLLVLPSASADGLKSLKALAFLNGLILHLALASVFLVSLLIVFAGIITGLSSDITRNIISGALIILLGTLLFGLASLRPDSWLLAIGSSFLISKSGFPSIGSVTVLPLPITGKAPSQKVPTDGDMILESLDQIVYYTHQAVPALRFANEKLASLPADRLFSHLSRTAFSLIRKNLILYSSASFENDLKASFLRGFFNLSPLRKRLEYHVHITQLRIYPPYRAVSAGFYLLYEERPSEAAQAFAVVRDIRHGEEMHGLASLLALFDAAEVAEQIASIELPDLPVDRTLRPQTWDAIRRFYHVVSDTKTAQASASRAARAFATNRALGELQHIIEYKADLPEAERSLVINIAKIWQNSLLEITAAVGEIDLTQPVRNPYVIGDPVEGDLFVGRDDILRQLQELWLMGNHLQSVVIYGHRRMGKTSILRNVSQVLGSGLRVAYVNLLQSAGAENISDVLLAISDQIAAVLHIDPPRDADMVAQPARTFERFFRRAIKTLREGEGLIIAIDEFEKIEELIAAGKLGDNFMAYLRGLVQDSPRVGFAFAGLHTLEEMSADYFQPFFASVIPIKVDFFKQATVQTLLPNPGGDFPLDYDYDALDLIWHLTAGQPYLTQLIGFQLVRRYNDQVFERQQPREAKFTVADVQAVVSQPEFFAQGKPYFSGVWAQAGHDAPGQQAILTALAPHPDGRAVDGLQEASGLAADTFAAGLTTLTHHNVVRLHDGTAKIIVEVFRRWVLSDRG